MDPLPSNCDNNLIGLAMHMANSGFDGHGVELGIGPGIGSNVDVDGDYYDDNDDDDAAVQATARWSWDIPTTTTTSLPTMRETFRLSAPKESPHPRATPVTLNSMSTTSSTFTTSLPAMSESFNKQSTPVVQSPHPRATPLTWTKDEVEEFVTILGGHPVVYNFRMKENRDEIFKSNAWKSVAGEMRCRESGKCQLIYLNILENRRGLACEQQKTSNLIVVN